MKSIKQLINIIIIAIFAAAVILAIIAISGYTDEGSTLYQEIGELEIAKKGGVTELKGSGTMKDPFLVGTKAELYFIAAQFEDNDIGQIANKWVYSLTNDIDMNIGEGSNDLCIGRGTEYSFDGVFLGNGYTIKNLEVTADKNAGLFAEVNGSIYDLNVAGSFSGEKAGAIAGTLLEYGIIANCSADAKCSGETAGGLIGESFGTVLNSVNYEENDIAGAIYGKARRCFKKSGKDYILTDDGSICGAKSAAAILNASMGKMNPQVKLHKWIGAMGQLGHSRETADVYTKCNVTATAAGKKLKIHGFFSDIEERWIIPYSDIVTLEDSVVTLKNSDTGLSINLTKEENYYECGEGERGCSIELVNMGDAGVLFLNTTIKNSLEYLHADKGNELTAEYTAVDSSSRLNVGNLIISGRGNDSFQHFDNWKNGFSLTLKNRDTLLGMPENEDFVLLAGYRYNSLMNYILERGMFKEMDFKYAYDYKIINVFIDGSYRGVYMLTGSQEIDKDRYDLDNSYAETEAMNDKKLSDYEKITDTDVTTSANRVYYDIPNVPEDVSGGYLLEEDFKDYPDSRSRFTSKRGTTITMKSNPYAAKAQVDYAADLWQDFEDALYAEDGYNDKGGYYADYLDLESMADLCLTYELAQDPSISGSVYFYLNKGERRLYAGNHWDSERGYEKLKAVSDKSWLGFREHGKYDDEGSGFFKKLYDHEDFIEALSKRWREKFLKTTEIILSDDEIVNEDGVSSLLGYKKLYEKESIIEHLRWPTSDVERKNGFISSFMKKRIEALSEWL